MRRNKGITLIALIITIIVMLILVAVSVNVLIKSNLLGTAEKAVDKYKTASEEEAKGGAIEINGKKYNSIEDYIETTKQLPNIEAGERAEINSNYKGVTIPKGFTVSGIKDEQTIDDGLVIYEIPAGINVDWTATEKVDTSDENSDTCYTVQKNYNQFVWVPVETPYVTKAELDKIIANSNGNITTEQAALQNLADSGKYPMAVELENGTDYRGVLYNFSAKTDKVNITVMDFSTTANYNDGMVTYMREPAKLSSTSNDVNQTEEKNLDLQSEYNNIVKSVKKQKGFWVARYELSYNTKGESKRGKTVTHAGDSATEKWYGLYNAGKTMYQANSKNEIQSNMIYGSQRDQIIIWMKDVKNIKDNSKYYIIDSSYMGNFNTSTGGTGEPQVSGYKNDYLVKQIFDLGGNLYDWTTEARNTDIRCLTGNDYYNSGSATGVYARNRFGKPNYNHDGASTRVALYISL